MFGWRVVKHVRSNAIVIARDRRPSASARGRCPHRLAARARQGATPVAGAGWPPMPSSRSPTACRRRWTQAARDHRARRLEARRRGHLRGREAGGTLVFTGRRHFSHSAGARTATIPARARVSHDSRLVGGTPIVQLPACSRRRRAGAGEARVHESGRFDQGSHRPAMIEAAERDGPLRPAARSSSPRRQHRRRARDGRRAERLPLRVRDAGQDVAREDRAAARLRRRGRGLPDRRSSPRIRAPTTRSRAAWPRRCRAPSTRPVLEPGEPAGPLRDHRARDLASRSAVDRRASSPASAPAARSPASGRYLKEKKPDLKIVGADPIGSIYRARKSTRTSIEGVGEDFWPLDVRPEIVDRWIRSPTAPRFLVTRGVAREEAILIGASGGTACTPR